MTNPQYYFRPKFYPNRGTPVHPNQILYTFDRLFAHPPARILLIPYFARQASDSFRFRRVINILTSCQSKIQACRPLGGAAYCSLGVIFKPPPNP